jgi:hypothetical protein
MAFFALGSTPRQKPKIPRDGVSINPLKQNKLIDGQLPIGILHF